MLTIKFYIILSDQIKMLQMLSEVRELKNWIAVYFNYYWLFVEPTLILISLLGFLLRKGLGFLLSLTFTSFVIAYSLLHYLTPIQHHENFHIGVLNWALFVSILINIPLTVKIFSTKLTRKLQIRANLLSLFIGLLINGIMLILTA